MNARVVREDTSAGIFYFAEKEKLSMKTNLRQLIPILAAAVLPGVARAQGYVQMQVTTPGTTVCTEQVEAANASIATSPNLNGLLTITLQESATANGPATVVFSSSKPSTSQKPVIVNPSKPGEYFWRLCGTNAGTPYSNYTFDASISFGGGTVGNQTIASTLANGLTAVLPPGAQFCAPFTGIPANRVGTAVQANTNTPVAVTWFDEDTDSNEDQLPNADVVVSATVNDVVQPEQGGNILGCVGNTSSVTVSVLFNFIGTFEGITYTQ
jgi:hypothetical protein